MKRINRCIKYINAYINQIIYQVFFIYIQPNQNISILRKDNNVIEIFWPYKDKKSTLKKQNIKKDHRNLMDKSLNIKNYIKDGLSGYTS